MKKNFLLLLLIPLCGFYAPIGVSMLGIKINDPANALKKIKLDMVASDETMTKYRTSNGNDFSVTVDGGKIVYMENDWLHDQTGTHPLFSNFKFGKTSLRDIRKAYATNGFTYTNRNDLTTETDLIEFNCFEFDSPNHEVLVAITKVSLKANVTETNIADSLKLESIVIANKNYLDRIWGADKVYDPNYKKIKI